MFEYIQNCLARGILSHYLSICPAYSKFVNIYLCVLQAFEQLLSIVNSIYRPYCLLNQTQSTVNDNNIDNNIDNGLELTSVIAVQSRTHGNKGSFLPETTNIELDVWGKGFSLTNFPTKGLCWRHRILFTLLQVVKDSKHICFCVIEFIA